MPYEAVRGRLGAEAAADREARFHEVGGVLFAAVDLARKLKVDPGLALRTPQPFPQGTVGAPRAWPHRTAATGTILRPTASSRSTRRAWQRTG